MLIAAPFGFFFVGYILQLGKRKAKERKETTIGLGNSFFPLFLLHQRDGIKKRFHRKKSIGGIARG